MNIFQGCSEEEISLARELYERGGAVVRTEWMRTKKYFKPTPPLAEVFKHQVAYDHPLPRTVLKKLKECPNKTVFVAWDDKIWRKVKEFFGGASHEKPGRLAGTGCEQP